MADGGTAPSDEAYPMRGSPSITQYAVGPGRRVDGTVSASLDERHSGTLRPEAWRRLDVADRFLADLTMNPDLRGRLRSPPPRRVIAELCCVALFGLALTGCGAAVWHTSHQTARAPQ
jgi:hypothetical protein